MSRRDSRGSSVRVRPRRTTEPSAPLRVGGLLAILGAGAVCTALGVLVVGTRFEARDLEIEARRMQEMTRERRDGIRQLETTISQMKRGEALREAALGPLGMVEPAASMMEVLEVNPERVEAFGMAARRARQRLVIERVDRETWKEEGF